MLTQEGTPCSPKKVLRAHPKGYSVITYPGTPFSPHPGTPCLPMQGTPCSPMPGTPCSPIQVLRARLCQVLRAYPCQLLRAHPCQVPRATVQSTATNQQEEAGSGPNTSLQNHNTVQSTATNQQQAESTATNQQQEAGSTVTEAFTAEIARPLESHMHGILRDVITETGQLQDRNTMLQQK